MRMQTGMVCKTAFDMSFSVKFMPRQFLNKVTGATFSLGVFLSTYPFYVYVSEQLRIVPTISYMYR